MQVSEEFGDEAVLELDAAAAVDQYGDDRARLGQDPERGVLADGVAGVGDDLVAVPFVQAPADAPLPPAAVRMGQVDLRPTQGGGVGEERSGVRWARPKATTSAARAQISPAGPTDRGRPHCATTAPCSSWLAAAPKRRTSSGSVQVWVRPSGSQICSRRAWSHTFR